MEELTHIDEFRTKGIGRWFAKREDMACYVGPARASGLKMRQYLKMADDAPGLPMLVGCTAHAAQQVYVADAAERTGRRGIIIVPARAKPTAETLWCKEHGAEVIEMRPGYTNVCRARAKAVAKELGGCVRWNPKLCLEDTARQVANLPRGCKRVVVPTGSGLVTAGVLRGLVLTKRHIPVLAICVSLLAKWDQMLALAMQDDGALKAMVRALLLPLVRTPMKYEKPVGQKLPDGTILDPLYAAKAYPYLEEGDCLWVTGCRPLGAMSNLRK